MIILFRLMGLSVLRNNADEAMDQGLKLEAPKTNEVMK